jgi:hypothetical protein
MKKEITPPELPIVAWTPETEIEPGFYYSGMPSDIYHKTKGDSKSSLDVFHDDPYKYYNRKEKEQTRPMQLGSAIHAAMLEPEVFAEDYIMLPTIKDRRQPEYKNAVKAFGAGKVFTNNECEKIEGMKSAIRQNDEAKRLLDELPGYFELSGFAIDPETGLMIRHRFDKLAYDGEKWIGVDLKKTTKIDEYSLSKKILDFRYHVQDQVYRHGFKLITGQELAEFNFVCIEEDYPHLVGTFELCDLSQRVGYDDYRFDMINLSQHKNGQASANNNRGKSVISLPEFALRDFDLL